MWEDEFQVWKEKQRQERRFKKKLKKKTIDKQKIDAHKKILTNLNNIMINFIKKNAFATFKYKIYKLKQEEKFQLYYDMENTFDYLNKNIPYSIEMWVMDD